VEKPVVIPRCLGQQRVSPGEVVEIGLDRQVEAPLGLPQLDRMPERGAAGRVNG